MPATDATDGAADPAPSADAAAATDAAFTDGPPPLTRKWKECGQFGMGRPGQLALSGDGQLVALLYPGGPVVLHRTGDLSVVRTLSFARTAPPAVVLSADGALLALGLADRIRIERSADGQVVWDNAGAYRPVMFSPDAKQLLVRGPGGMMELWDVETQAWVRNLGISEVATFTEGGRAVAVYIEDYVSIFRGAAAPVSIRLPLSGPQFSPRGDLILGSEGNDLPTSIVAYRIPEGTRVWATRRKIYPGVRLVFSPDQRRLMGIDGARLSSFDVDTGVEGAVETRAAEISDVAMGPAGAPIIIADGGGVHRTTLPRLTGGDAFSSPFPGQLAPIVALALSRDGRRLATAAFTPSGGVTLWDVAGGTVVRTIAAARATAGISFAPDGDRLLRSFGGIEEYAAGAEDPGRPIAPATLDPQSIWLATYSPDGQHIAFAHRHRVHVVKQDSLAVVGTIATGWPSPAFAFSPDGRTIAVSGPQLHHLDGRRIWPTTADPAPEPGPFVDHSMTFSPDGRTLLESRLLPDSEAPPHAHLTSRSHSTATRFYDAGTGLHVIGPPILVPRRPSYSPDGAWLLAGARVYSFQQKRQFSLPAPYRILVSAFTPDGRIVAGLVSGQAVVYCPD